MNSRLEGHTPSEPAPEPASSWKQLTGYQWLVLLVAWLGWVFDSMDALIYAQVMTPALKELLGAHASPQNIGWYGGIIFSIFIVGWALGGILFGVLADYLGRSRTLVITILVYAVFTALAGFSHTWWELGIYRFLTALGVGGEWAAGATLVAEVWPESLRVKGAGLLQSAWGFGFFLAAGFNLLLSAYSWRVMFFVGIMPALVAVLLRLKVHEPERWTSQHLQAKRPGSQRLTIVSLFLPETRRDTLVGTALAFVVVFGLWGATNWTPSLITELLRPLHLDAITTAQRVSFAVISLNAGAILGYLDSPFDRGAVGQARHVPADDAGFGALASHHLPDTHLLLHSHVATTFPGILLQRDFQRLPDLLSGNLSHPHPSHRRRILLQRRAHLCRRRAVLDRLSRGPVRIICARCELHRVDLCPGPAHPALRA